jgi:endonuclease YncB( thermonuclease family)
MVLHSTSFLLLAAVLIPTIVCAADYTGRVVEVIDCDTIEFLNGHYTGRIRPSGIDRPERGTCMVPGTTTTNQKLTGMLPYVTLLLCEGIVLKHG